MNILPAKHLRISDRYVIETNKNDYHKERHAPTKLFSKHYNSIFRNKDK